MQASPLMRTVNTDWGSRVPVMHFRLNQDRLQASGLSSQSVAQQLQFLLSGSRSPPSGKIFAPCRRWAARQATSVWIRRKSPTSPWWAAAGSGSLADTDWRRVDQDGGPAASPSRPHADHHHPHGDVAENLQPPDVSTALMKPLPPIIDSLPPGYRQSDGGVD